MNIKVIILLIPLYLTCYPVVTSSQPANLSYTYSSVLIYGKSRPYIDVLSDSVLKDIRISLKRSDGRILRFRIKSLGVGQKKRIYFRQPEGVFTYQISIYAIDHEGNHIELHNKMRIAVLRPLALKILKDSVDFDKRSCRISGSRNIKKVVMYLKDINGTGFERTYEFNQPKREFKIEWEEDTVKINLKAYDQYGLWTGMEIVPWWMEIPHKEVVFDTDSAEIRKDQEYKLKEALKRIFDAIKKFKSIGPLRLYVAGYTDTVGNSEYNLKLSKMRAKSIALYFKNAGFPYTIFYKGLGEMYLKVKTEDETPEERNRRVRYILTKDFEPNDKQLPSGGWFRLR